VNASTCNEGQKRRSSPERIECEASGNYCIDLHISEYADG
jgi:hypothetical protein